MEWANTHELYTIDKPEALKIMDGIVTVNLKWALNDYEKITWINEK